MRVMFGKKAEYSRVCRVALSSALMLLAVRAADAENIGFQYHTLSNGGEVQTQIPCDLNGDGRIDFLSLENIDSWLFGYVNQGGSPPAFTRTQIYSGVRLTIAVADMTGDGRDNVFLQQILRVPQGSPLAWERVVSWLELDPTSLAITAKHPFYVSGVFEETQDMRVGDVNGDGALDLYEYYSGWWMGAVNETSFEYQPGHGGHALDDIDGDGDMDFLQWQAWCENLGGNTPTFVKHEGIGGAGLADFDGDGRLDILNATHWLKNNGGQPPEFERRDIEFPLVARRFAIGDLDGDGDVDFVAGTWFSDETTGGPSIYWFENDGDGNFTAHFITDANVGETAALNIADFDGDGDADILVGQLFNATFILENVGPVTPTPTPSPTPDTSPTPTLSPTPSDVPEIGRDWYMARAHADWSGREGHAAVVFDGKMWVMGGRGADGYLNDVWSSVDGTNWVEQSADAHWSPRLGAAIVEFDGRMWITGGETAVGVFSNEVWHSADGVDWTEADTPAWPSRTGHSLTVYKGNLYLAGGYTYEIRNGMRYMESRRDVYRSSDGLQWQLVTSEGPWAGLETGMASDSDWLWFTQHEWSDFRVWRSADGATWENVVHRAPLNWGRAHHLRPFRGSLWFFMSENNNAIWSTDNGVEWVEHSFRPHWASRTGIASSGFADRIWVLGGRTNDEYLNDIWYTTDLPIETPTPSSTPTRAPTHTPSPMLTATPTATPSATASETPIMTPSASPVPDQTAFYMLDGWGTLWRAPATLPVPMYGSGVNDGTWPWFGWDIVRGLAVTPERDGFYMLDGYGAIWCFGQTLRPRYGSYRLPWFGVDLAADVGVNEAGDGILVLDAHGNLYPYGNFALSPALMDGVRPWFHFDHDFTRAQPPVLLHLTGEQAKALADYGFADPPPGVSRYNPANRGLLAAEAVVLTPSGTGGYLLDSYGGIHTLGDVDGPEAIADVWPYFGWNIARDLRLTADGMGAWILDGWGGIHAIGTAEPAPYGPGGLPYFQSYDIARSLHVVTIPGEP